MPYVYQYGPGQMQMPGPVYGYQPGGPQGQLEQLRAAQGQVYVQQPGPAPAAAQGGNGGTIWVQGVEGAKSYMVAPGASVMLMDSEDTAFYIKSADGSGMPLPLRAFRYVEETTQAAQKQPVTASVAPVGDYATRAELAAVRAELDAIRAAQETRTESKRLPPVDVRKDGVANGKESAV